VGYYQLSHKDSSKMISMLGKDGTLVVRSLLQNLCEGVDLYVEENNIIYLLIPRPHISSCGRGDAENIERLSLELF
jgi:hypothetical protein